MLQPLPGLLGSLAECVQVLHQGEQRSWHLPEPLRPCL